MEAEIARRSRELKNNHAVKVILTLLIVLYHSIVFWSSKEWFLLTPSVSAPVLSVVAQILDHCHIYCFTLVSGYIYYAVRYEKGRYESFAPFIKNKAKRLLLPFYAVTLMWTIPHHIIWYGFDAKRIVVNYIFGASPDQLWFLLMLFWVFAIVWPLSDFARRHVLISLSGGVVLWAIGSFLPTANYLQYKTGLSYVIFFLLGMYVREFDLLGRVRGRVLTVSALGVAFVGGFVLLKVVEPANFILKAGLIFGGLVTKALGALFLFFLLQYAADAAIRHWERIVVFSQYSMVVYLFHQQLVQDALALVYTWDRPYLISLCCFTAALSSSALIAFLTSRWRVSRLLFCGNG